MDRSRQRQNRFDQQHRKYPFVRVQKLRNLGDLIIQAELPGFNENDVKLEATEEGLVIMGAKACAYCGP